MSQISINFIKGCAAVASAAVTITAASGALGEPLGYAPSRQQTAIFDQVLRQDDSRRGASEMAAHLQRRVIAYRTREAPGTIVIDTPNTQLYYVLGGGKAISYGIGVGREGFTWSGVQTVARKAEWPDWIPPAEMLQRQPYLPRFMAGGPGNPLGARALYLGNTVYRIHGTNAPDTIGAQVSSGCIRMLNEDVIDLYGRVGIGTKVVVLPQQPRATSRFAPGERPIVETRSRAPNSQPDRISGLY